MNEYFSIIVSVSSLAVGLVMGYAVGTLRACNIWEQKQKLANGVSPHQTEPVKTWAPVERFCNTHNGPYWADASYQHTDCPDCRNRKLYPRSTV